MSAAATVATPQDRSFQPVNDSVRQPSRGTRFHTLALHGDGGSPAREWTSWGFVTAGQTIGRVVRWEPIALDAVVSHSWDLLHKQLAELRVMQKGWNSYNADPPNELAIQTTDDLVECARDIIKPDAIVASVEGGAALVFERGALRADIESFNDGDILALISAPNSRPHVWPVARNLDEYREALQKIRDFIEG